MKIVMLSDLDETGELISNIDTSDSEIYDIYDIGEHDNEDGYVQFMSCYGEKSGWYIGLAPGVKIDFDDGSSREFLGLHDPYGDRDSEMISEVIAELRRIVFGFDNEEDDPDTDMPDIF